MKTESPDRDPTWLQSLPKEALRCLMKHMLEVSQGFFRPDIHGALLRSSADKFSVEKFHQTSRVTQRFTTAFKIAYDSLAAAAAREQTAEEGGQPASATGGQLHQLGRSLRHHPKATIWTSGPSSGTSD